MPWITILIFVLGVVLTIATKSLFVTTIGLLAAGGALIFGIFSFISARISENSRSEVTLLTDHDLQKLRTSIQQARAQKEGIAGAGTSSIPSPTRPASEIVTTPGVSKLEKSEGQIHM